MRRVCCCEPAQHLGAQQRGVQQQMRAVSRCQLRHEAEQRLVVGTQCRSLKPDFVLVRQHGRDAQHDWRNVIIGLQYGGVASINSLPATYCFLDKPYVVRACRKLLHVVTVDLHSALCHELLSLGHSGAQFMDYKLRTMHLHIYCANIKNTMSS